MSLSPLLPPIEAVFYAYSCRKMASSSSQALEMPLSTYELNPQSIPGLAYSGYVGLVHRDTEPTIFDILYLRCRRCVLCRLLVRLADGVPRGSEYEYTGRALVYIANGRTLIIVKVV